MASRRCGRPGRPRRGSAAGPAASGGRRPLPSRRAPSPASHHGRQKPPAGHAPAPSERQAERAKSPEYGMNVFVWGNPEDDRPRPEEDDRRRLRLAEDAVPVALHRAEEGPVRLVRGRPVVKASKAAGIKIPSILPASCTYRGIAVGAPFQCL